MTCFAFLLDSGYSIGHFYQVLLFSFLFSVKLTEHQIILLTVTNRFHECIISYFILLELFITTCQNDGSFRVQFPCSEYLKL